MIHILVVGAGSAGRRHACNFAAEGVQVSCCDPRPDRLAQASAEIPGLVGAYDSLDRALVQADRLTGVVIASPPSFHVDQALAALEQGLPILLEKPLATDFASGRRLLEAVRAASTPVLLGYTYRWWPPLLEMRRRIHAGEIGTPLHVRMVMSAHLADWHPWERYQEFFMASQELGGGALLDESHWIDVLIWFFGLPEAINGRVERLSRLEITTDDTVDMHCVYRHGLRATLHLDLYGRPHEKRVTVVGDAGTMECLFDPNVVRVSHTAEATWSSTPFAVERNDMFVAEARAFLQIVTGDAPPGCTVADGVMVLRCVEAVRASTRTGCAVELATLC